LIIPSTTKKTLLAAHAADPMTTLRRLKMASNQYKSKPRYIVRRGVCMAPVCNVSSHKFKKYLEDSKNAGLRHRVIDFEANSKLESWLYIEQIGVTEQNLERWGLHSMAEYYKKCLEDPKLEERLSVEQIIGFLEHKLPNHLNTFKNLRNAIRLENK
jgi:hypothetical protein